MDKDKYKIKNKKKEVEGIKDRRLDQVDPTRLKDTDNKLFNQDQEDQD